MLKSLVVLITVLAMALPSMAAVTLTGSASGQTVTVGYSYDGTGQRPRAFGLVLTSAGGTITSVTPVKTGESTAAAAGYGIFPGTISIATDGTVSSYGTPVEPTALPGGPSQLGTNRVVVALGSLYKGDANKPGNNANLFSVVVGTGTTSLTITPETTSRKGVVGEDATQITVDPLTIQVQNIPDVPTGFAASDGTSATQNSLTWAASAGATGYDIKYNNKNDLASAVVLASNVATNSYNHVTNHGETIFYWVCAKNAAGSSAYSTPDSGYLTECFPNTVPLKKTRWVTYGRPDCWCYARNCKGDATGTSDGKTPTGPYWVSVGDLNVLKSGWNKLDAQLAGNNICADFSRSSDGKTPTGPYAVSVGDLNILKSNWNIVNGPASGLCEATKAVVAPSGPMP